MRSVVTPAYYSRGFEPDGYARSLAPFVTIHEVELSKRTGPEKPWAWTDERIVRKTLELTWQMTGAWKARRGVPVKSRKDFERIVVGEVISLTRLFNRRKISCLKDLSQSTAYRAIVNAIESSIAFISGTRPTKLIQPVLGSKVLHHYFPSIIPVFDTEYVSKRILRSRAASSLDAIFGPDESSADFGSEVKMQEFDEYLWLCSFQVRTADRDSLQQVRSRCARDCRGFFPHSLSLNRNSILWRLDAKIAENCLIGAARS